MCKNEYNGSIKINCSRCPTLKQIPVIHGLKLLECSHRPELEYIRDPRIRRTLLF